MKRLTLNAGRQEILPPYGRQNDTLVIPSKAGRPTRNFYVISNPPQAV